MFGIILLSISIIADIKNPERTTRNKNKENGQTYDTEILQYDSLQECLDFLKNLQTMFNHLTLSPSKEDKLYDKDGNKVAYIAQSANPEPLM